jgi:hypothetical protein
MKPTHYEGFSAHIAPYRQRAKQVADILATNSRAFKTCSPHFPQGVRDRPISSMPGLWPVVVMKHLQGTGITNGKKTAALYTSGMSLQKIGYAADAFVWEVFARIFDDSANQDGTWSLGNALFTRDFAMMLHSLEALGTNAHSLAEVAFHGIGHERAGKRVYEVAAGLADKLKLTELRGLTSADIRLPYNNIYIVAPPECDFHIYNDMDHQWHQLEGVYISEDKFGKIEPQPPHAVQISADMSNVTCTDGLEYADRKAVRSFSFMFVGGPGKDKFGNPIPNDDAVFFFRIYFPEDDSIVNDCIESTKLRNIKYSKSLLLQKMAGKWEPIVNWCLNVVMYATCVAPQEELLSKEAQKLWQRIEATPKGTKTRTNLEQQLKRLDHGRTVLGRTIVLDRTRPEPDPSNVGKGRKITVRTRVAGHWRRVRCGKKWESSRMVFIEPFWRGPELGEQVAKKHVLK